MIWVICYMLEILDGYNIVPTQGILNVIGDTHKVAIRLPHYK